MGRPTKGLSLLEAIMASDQAHERAKVILLTLCGDWTVQEALERLELGRTRFRQLRLQLLEGALQALESQPVGRPPRGTKEDPQLAALREQVAELERALRMARTELALLRGPAREAVLARQGAVR